jgi:hypothetical protein
MKKVAVFGLALAMAFSVNAQQEDTGSAGSGASAGTIGGIATGSIVAGAVAAGVLAAVISNNRSDTAPVEEKKPSCNGTDLQVNNVCTGTQNKVVVTGTGTNTRTVSVPVTFTYAPTVK